MDNSNAYIQLSALHRREKTLTWDCRLADNSYMRAKYSVGRVLETEPSLPNFFEISPADVVAFLDRYERINQEVDRAWARYEQTRSLLYDSLQFLTPHVRHVITHELSYAFAKRNAVVPNIVNQITNEALKYSALIANQRLEDCKEAFRLMLSTQLKTNYESPTRDLYLAIASNDNDMKMAIFSYCDEWMIRRRKQKNRLQGMLRYIQHKIWKARNQK